jgi:hypothetical protein
MKRINVLSSALLIAMGVQPVSATILTFSDLPEKREKPLPLSRGWTAFLFMWSVLIFNILLQDFNRRTAYTT